MSSVLQGSNQIVQTISSQGVKIPIDPYKYKGGSNTIEQSDKFQNDLDSDSFS